MAAVTNFFRASRFWMFSSIVLIAFGVFFRVFQYLQNRSLWLDEMYLSSSIIKMNFRELATLPLDYEQKAPIGYLYMARASVMLFGKGEMALRLFPLISSFIALLVFFPTARFFLRSKSAIAIAVGILALAPPLVYHSVEAKQYSTELLGTVLSLFVYSRYTGKSDYKSLFIWGGLGALIVWFSFSSIFILTGIAAAVSFYNLIKRDWKVFFLCLIPFAIWMVSFCTNYLSFTSKHADSEWLLLWFKYRGGFMPAGFIAGAGWLADKIFSLTNFPMGLSWLFLPKKYDGNYLLLLIARMAFVPLILMIVGLVFSYKKAIPTFLILILPISFHLLATLMGLYPFFERLTVYLTPILVLLLALGVEAVTEATARHHTGTNRQNTEVKENVMAALRTTSLRDKWGLLFAILILTGPLMHSTKDIFFTDSFGRIKHWHQRELYIYLSENYRPGDAVYIYWNALVPYHYYSKIYNYKFKPVEGKDNRFCCTDLISYKQKLDGEIRLLRLKYKRIWVVKGDLLEIKIGEIDNQPPWYYLDRKANLEMRAKVFGTIGPLLSSYKTKESISVYLYQVKKPAKNFRTLSRLD